MRARRWAWRLVIGAALTCLTTVAVAWYRELQMNIAWNGAWVGMVIGILSGCGQVSRDPRPGVPYQESSLEMLARAYASAPDDREKRDIFVRAMDSGAIKYGGSIDVVRNLSGADFKEFGPREDESEYGIVQFNSVRPAPDGYAPVWDAWYFEVNYRHGKIEKYCLTNSHNK